MARRLYLTVDVADSLAKPLTTGALAGIYRNMGSGNIKLVSAAWDRPRPERVTADGVTEADVFAGCAAVALPAQRRCPGDRHYVGTEVARLATGVLYSCRDCPAEFVVEDDGTHVPVGEGSS